MFAPLGLRESAVECIRVDAKSPGFVGDGLGGAGGADLRFDDPDVDT